MAVAQLGTIREVFDRVRDSAARGDGELLARYRRDRDQDAFGSLVRRHGPMVLGVCRRVLRDSHAAEDAFQATFVVLARKADAVRPPERLAPWLYGVAYRTALKARGRAFRRQQVEQAYVAEVANRPAPTSGEAAELLPVIDEQLNALPEKYRTPLLLCALQGLNKAEAAERLGLPEGTISSRLARAREMLRDRLTRRGVAVPAAALAGLLSADSLRAAVPPALADAASGFGAGTALASPTVLSLAHEVTRSMTLLKLKALCAVALCATLAGGGFGLYAIHADEKKPAKPTGDKPVIKPEGERPKPAKPDGQKPGQPRLRKSGGQVAGVNAKEGTLMLAIKGDGGIVERLVKVAPDARVFIDDKQAKLADVPKNSFAALLLAAGKEGELPTATEVRVTGRTAIGVIKEAGANGIALQSEKKPQEFKIDSGTKVTVNGRPAKAADLKAGDKVVVVLKADDSAALSVAAGEKRGDGDKPRPDGERPAKYRQFGGRVVSVDANARTVTLAAKGDAGQPMVVKLTADAKVLVDGKEAKLADVPKGAPAVFTLASAKDGQPREASELVVSGPTFGGSVKQIDAGSITVGNEKTDRVLKLSAATKVTIDGKAAKLADLKTGDRVQVTLSADETSALLIAAGEKRAGDKPKPKPEK
jgi:RNA polymerase sigma factor (sigma-70 family)